MARIEQNAAGTFDRVFRVNGREVARDRVHQEPCGNCLGMGWETIERRWHAITVPCDDCGGNGRQWSD